MTTLTVTTASNAQLLRDYAATKQHDAGVVIFPENNRSAAEQASIISELAPDTVEVITFSPFVLSDAPTGSLQILDSGEASHGIKHADSVNRITMRLWRRSTIGQVGEAAIEQIRSQMQQTDDVATLETLANTLTALGDSIERHMLITEVYRKINQANT